MKNLSRRAMLRGGAGVAGISVIGIGVTLAKPAVDEVKIIRDARLLLKR